MKLTRAALTPIWVATRGTADMMKHTVWKLYVLIGEGWYCCGEYLLEKQARAAEFTLRQQGDTTMVRRMSVSPY